MISTSSNGMHLIILSGTSQRHFGEDINIQRFGPVVEILSSKQRPRKLSIFGDDGKEYKYLLKGREDLRLDERW